MWHYLLIVPKYLLGLAPLQTSIPSPQHTNTRDMQAFIFRSILPIFGCYKHFTKEWKETILKRVKEGIILKSHQIENINNEKNYYYYFLKEPNGNSGATRDSNPNGNSLDGLNSRFIGFE